MPPRCRGARPCRDLWAHGVHCRIVAGAGHGWRGPGDQGSGAGRNMAWIRVVPRPSTGAISARRLRRSLTRLGTDYIDLYQLHWPARNQPMFGQWRFEPGHEGPATPIEEQLVALAELVAEGRSATWACPTSIPGACCRFCGRLTSWAFRASCRWERLQPAQPGIRTVAGRSVLP
jgi:hypothetical protein